MNGLISRQKIYFWIAAISVLLMNLTLELLFWPRQELTEREQARVYIANELGLILEQQNLFEELSNKYSKLINSITQQINKEKKEIVNEVFEKGNDIEKINPLAKNIGRLSVKIEKFRFEYYTKIKSILRDNQLKEFEKIIEKSLESDSLIVPQNELLPPQPRKIF
jgi:hypothetical protein